MHSLYVGGVMPGIGIGGQMPMNMGYPVNYGNMPSSLGCAQPVAKLLERLDFFISLSYLKAGNAFQVLNKIIFNA